MCNNEKLTHNVKVKSRNAELFLFKKNDFLKLSFNYKEFINNFLQKSIVLYIKFNDEKKKAIQTYEIQNNMKPSIFKDEKLGDIKEENEGSEEYDVFAEHDIYSEDEDVKDDNKNNQSQKKNTSSILFPDERNSIKKIFIDKNNNIRFSSMSPIELKNCTNKNNKKPSFLKSEAIKFKSIPSSFNLNIIEESNNRNSVQSNNFGKKRRNSLEQIIPNNFNEIKSEVEPLMELNGHVNNLKNNLHKKFSNNVSNILGFFENHKTQFENVDEEKNPLTLLTKLKITVDPNEKNDLIEKLESFSYNF
jgi:hypothetical protein